MHIAELAAARHRVHARVATQDSRRGRYMCVCLCMCLSIYLYVSVYMYMYIYIKLARAQWACRGAPDPSAPQAASDFDPTSHADFGAATHPGVAGGTHRRRATFERC